MCVLSHQLLTITHFKNNLKPHVQTETRSNICMMQTGAMWPVIGTNNCILEKTVQWKQGLKPSCNGNINTMINMQLKVSTYAAPARKNTQTNSISISLFLENFSRPLLGSSLPFSNFSTASPPPLFLGFLVRPIPHLNGVGEGGSNYVWWWCWCYSLLSGSSSFWYAAATDTWVRKSTYQLVLLDWSNKCAIDLKMDLFKLDWK